MVEFGRADRAALGGIILGVTVAVMCIGLWGIVLRNLSCCSPLRVMFLSHIVSGAAVTFVLLVVSSIVGVIECSMHTIVCLVLAPVMVSPFIGWMLSFRLVRVSKTEQMKREPERFEPPASVP